jgi:hypothetical protein
MQAVMTLLSRSWLMIVNRSGDADKPPPLKHAAGKHVLGLDPRMDPHPGHARVQAFRTDSMLSLLKSITFMRFDWFNQNAS